MILLAAVLVFLGAFVLLWWAFGPRELTPRDDGQDYFPFWRNEDKR